MPCWHLHGQHGAGPQRSQRFFVPCETWPPPASPVSRVVTLALSMTTRQREKVTGLCQGEGAGAGTLGPLNTFHFSLGKLRGHGPGLARCGCCCVSPVGSRTQRQALLFTARCFASLRSMPPGTCVHTSSLAKPVPQVMGLLQEMFTTMCSRINTSKGFQEGLQFLTDSFHKVHVQC